MSMFRFANRIGLSCALAVCAFVVPSRADEACAPTLVSTYGLGYPVSIEVVGDAAYVGALGYGLVVLDVSDPTEPVVLGQVDELLEPETRWDTFSGLRKRLAVEGDRVYVADGMRGVQIYDVSDPSNPSQLGRFEQPVVDTNYSAHDVAVSGSTMCVANEINLLLVDVSDPANPSLYPPEGFGLFGRIRGVTTRGDVALVVGAFAGGGFACVDISDPANPKLLGRTALQAAGFDVVVEGDLAYVAFSAGSGVMQIIDVSDPSNPETVAIVESADDFKGTIVSVDEGIACVLGRFDGQPRIIDVTDPANPAVVGSIETPPGWETSGIAVRNGVAFLASTHSGVGVADVSGPEKGRLIGQTRRLTAEVTDVMVFGDVVYAPYPFEAQTERGLEILDVSDPTTPTKIARAFPEYWVSGGAELEGRPYVAVGAVENGADPKLLVLDVSDARSPAIAGEVELAGADYADDVAIVGDLACVLARQDDEGRLFVVDVSVPTEPVVLGSRGTGTDNFYGPGRSWITASGTTAYAAMDSDVVIFDISNPASPDELWKMRRSRATSGGVIARDDLLFVSDWDTDLGIFDVSDPQRPSLITNIDLPYEPMGLELRDDVLIVAARRGVLAGELHFVDVSDVHDPVMLGSVQTPRLVYDVALSDGQAYLAMSTAGLGVVDTSFCLGPCPADWDGNGAVNAGDVGAFLSVYFLDLLNGTTVADFNEDGVTNTADVGAFLSAYFPAQGACP